MTSVVHYRKNTHIPRNQDGGSVQVVNRKLDLDHINDAYAYGKTHTWSNSVFGWNFSLGDSNDICDPEQHLKYPRNVRVPGLDITLRSSASGAVSAWLW